MEPVPPSVAAVSRRSTGLVAVSKKFAELCRERGLAAEHVDGQSSERQATLERFRKGADGLVADEVVYALDLCG